MRLKDFKLNSYWKREIREYCLYFGLNYDRFLGYIQNNPWGFPGQMRAWHLRHFKNMRHLILDLMLGSLELCRTLEGHIAKERVSDTQKKIDECKEAIKWAKRGKKSWKKEENVKD